MTKIYKNIKLLIICTGNSCRSQIAHGYLQNLLPETKVYSAGIESHGVNPLAIKVMNDDNIDISKHTSNIIDEYKNINFDYVITVCDNAKERCPFFPAHVKMIHKSFLDPAKATGTKAEILNEFVRVRDMIKDFCISLQKQID